MADLFLIRERLKFSLKLLAVGVAMGLLATWHFRGQLEFDADRSRFALSAVVTGGLVLGWLGTLLFYLAVRRVVDPSKHLTDRIDNLPWWFIKISLLVLCIAAMGFYIVRYSSRSENEFDLLHHGHMELLEERVQANPALLERLDSKGGLTLIQMAYRENDSDAVSMLLQNGAATDGMDAEGRNPIIASLENLPMLESLLNAGLNPNLTDAEGTPPIHHAVMLRSPEAVSLLLKADAIIDARDVLYRTPLLLAVENEDLPMLKMLLENAAGANEFDRRGDTALHKAARRRNVEMIRLLLEMGADPRIFNFAQMTPMHLVAIGGHTDLVTQFLEMPDMVNLHGNNDLTPLDLALRSGKYETAELLIEHGADINRVLANGDTLLHQVILDRNYQVARFLIRAGGDVLIANAQGETALDIMRRKQLQGLLDLVEARDHPVEDEGTNVVTTVESF